VVRAHNAARVSISGSACYETSKVHGGKSHFANLLLSVLTEERTIDDSIDKTCYRYNLSTGNITDELCETTGEKIFHSSIAALKRNYENFFDVNLSIIAEPGFKARAVTSSSFFHSEFLQVYSHISLELLRSIPECASGVSKSRHGWAFAESLDQPWLFDLKKGETNWGLSTDLETATDYFSWNVLRDLLECFNDFFGIPDWYGKEVIRVLTTSRRVYYKGELVLDHTSRGCLMGDPCAKTVLTAVGVAAIYRCKLRDPRFIGSIVGDDYGAVARLRSLLDSRVYRDSGYGDPNDLGNYPEVCLLSTLVEFGLRISDVDTYVSRYVVYFAEECIFIPQGIKNTVQSALAAKDRSRIPYVDIVKGRLVINAKKNRDDFSYTPTGRITQLGRDKSYCHQGSHRILFDIASICQDVCLDLLNYKGFVYFPAEVSGEGKPFLFDNPRNFIRWVDSHRNGAYRSRINWLIDQAVMQSDHNVYGVTASKLSAFHSNMNRHFPNEGWRIKIPDLIPKSIAPVLTIPKYQEVLPGILGRLSSYLMSRSELIGKLASAMNMEAHIQEVEHDIETLEIESYPFDDDFVEDVFLRRFCDLWLHHAWRFKHLRSELWYLRDDAEKYLSERHTLRVDFHFGGNVILEDQNLSRKKEQAKNLFDWFLKAQEAVLSGTIVPEIPRATLSDDELILTYDLKEDEPVVWLISADLRLAREYALRRMTRFGSRYRTFVLPPKYWILARGQKERFSTPSRGRTQSVCQRAMVPPMTEENLVYDTGAIDTAFERIVGVAVGQHLPPHLRHLDDGRVNPERNRLRLISTEVTPVLPFEEYRDSNERIIAEFIQLKDEHLEAVVSNAEIRVSGYALGLARRETRFSRDLGRD
jgi:hypothetical protein